MLAYSCGKNRRTRRISRHNCLRRSAFLSAKLKLGEKSDKEIAAGKNNSYVSSNNVYTSRELEVDFCIITMVKKKSEEKVDVGRCQQDRTRRRALLDEQIDTLRNRRVFIINYIIIFIRGNNSYYRILHSRINMFCT